MGLNKISLALLMLLAVAALAHARTDLFKPSFFRKFDNDNKKQVSSLECCDTCECLEGYACFCSDEFADSCGEGCNNCICTRSIPATCQCLDTLKTCPSKCASQATHISDDQFESINHLALNKNSN